MTDIDCTPDNSDSENEPQYDEKDRLVEKPFTNPFRTLHRYEQKVFDHEVVCWIIFKDRLELVAAIRKQKEQKTTDDKLWEAIWDELSTSVINFYGSSARYHGPNWDLFHLIAQQLLGDKYPTDDRWAHYAHRLNAEKQMAEFLDRLKSRYQNAIGRDALTIHTANYPIISTVLAVNYPPFRLLTDESNNELWKSFLQQ